MFKSLRQKSNGVFARADTQAARRSATTAKIVVLTIAGFVTGSVLLAASTTVPELVRAQGELLPAGHYQPIQAPEQGIVRSVLVTEGQHVEPNQLLMILTSAELEQSSQDIWQDLTAARNRLENLQAITDFVKARLQSGTASEAMPAAADLPYAASQLALLAAQQDVQQILKEHLQSTNKKLEIARALTVERITARDQRVSRAEQLFSSGLTSRRDLELQQDGLDQLEANLTEIDIRLAQAAKDLGGVQATMRQNLISLLDKAEQEIFETEERRDKLVLQSEALASRKEALEIRAPASGVIHAVRFPNPGEVIAVGTTLFELLPSGRQLVAELKIDPVDLGHIARGDSVALKLDTFDARRFGQIDGQIESISPNSVMDERTGASHFRATVLLDQASIGQGAWQRPLQAGMGTSAEIVTDQRTVLAYLIKPIIRTLDSAFGER